MRKCTLSYLFRASQPDLSVRFRTVAAGTPICEAKESKKNLPKLVVKGAALFNTLERPVVRFMLSCVKEG